MSCRSLVPRLLRGSTLSPAIAVNAIELPVQSGHGVSCYEKTSIVVANTHKVVSIYTVYVTQG